MFVSGLYLTLFILSALAVCLLLGKISNRKSSYYVIFFTLISVVCLAYFAYSVAKDASMALVANQFSYLDGTFVMTFFLFCMLDICGISIKKWFAIPLVLINLGFLGLAFTSAYNKLFYDSIEYAQDYGAAHLKMEFGPFYTPYVIYDLIMMIIPIGIVIYSFFHKKKISYKYTTALAVLLIAIVGIYFAEYYLGLGFDLLPCGYVLMEYVVLVVIQRIGLYDVTQIVVNARDKSNEVGCIIIDKQHCYVGADITAKYYFPELDELEIDRKITNSFIQEEFVNWIDELDEKGEVKSKIYTRKERKILCDLRLYSPGKKDHVYGYIIELRDDTEQQNLIEQLNVVNVELSEAVEEANSANRSKSMFLANMSHEIRTPINAIMGMSAIARRQCKDEILLSYLEDIENASNNLLAIINDILDFSKIEAGKIDIIEHDYEAAKLLKDVEDLVAIKAHQKNLNLHIKYKENYPSVAYGDENRIRQIMVNVLNNAVKYTHEGSVTLELMAKNVNMEFFDMVIRVTDTGIGIKEEDLEKLFDSFSRVDGAKNKNIEGTGLGLAITHRLIQHMNGRIEVESEYGKGSTFTVTIPQILIDETPMGDYHEKYKKAREEKRKIEKVEVQNMSILVVDDNVVNLRVAEGLLQPTKAKIVSCKSGKECLEQIAKEHFDIIFLDHMMPEMDGVETLQEAKRMEDNYCKDSAYIVMTANAIEGAREQYLQEGFDDYVSKPIRPDELIELVSKYSTTRYEA